MRSTAVLLVAICDYYRQQYIDCSTQLRTAILPSSPVNLRPTDGVGVQRQHFREYVHTYVCKYLHRLIQSTGSEFEFATHLRHGLIL